MRRPFAEQCWQHSSVIRRYNGPVGDVKTSRSPGNAFTHQNPNRDHVLPVIQREEETEVGVHHFCGMCDKWPDPIR